MDDQLLFHYVGSGTFQKIKFEKISKKVIGYNITTLILSKIIMIKAITNIQISLKI
jgi:hypothetical protein